MAQDSEPFDGWREGTQPSETPPWTVRKHLCWAGILLGMSLVELALDGIEGFHSAPLLIGLLIVAHGVAVATVPQDRVEKVSQRLAPLVGIGWIVSDYLIDGISRWDILGYSVGASLLAAGWVWDRRARPAAAAAQTGTT